MIIGDPSLEAILVFALFVHEGCLCVAPDISFDNKIPILEGLRLIVEFMSVMTKMSISTCRVNLVNLIYGSDEDYDDYVFKIVIVNVDDGTGVYHPVPFLLSIYHGRLEVTSAEELTKWATALRLVIPGPMEIIKAGIDRFRLVKISGVLDEAAESRSMTTMDCYRSGKFTHQRTRVRPSPINLGPFYYMDNRKLFIADQKTNRHHAISGRFVPTCGFSPSVAIWCGQEPMVSLTALRASFLQQGIQILDCDDPSVDPGSVNIRFCSYGDVPRGESSFNHLPILWVQIGSEPAESPSPYSVGDEDEEDELVASPEDDSDMTELGYERQEDGGWVLL